MPAAKPKSRNFKAEREARAKEQAERRKQQDNRQNVIARTISVMVTTEINDHKRRNEQRNQGSERRNNRPDQRRGEQAQVAPKVDFKARAAARKLNKMLSTHVEVKIATNNKLQKQNKNVNSAGNG